ncbi:MAG: hypothetical protein AB7R55_08140 [Gemmatimonadales bacterium]
MQYESIVELLNYATGQEQPVRITTLDRREIVGIPTSVDREIGAHEVYLHPIGAEEIEIAVSLTQISRVDIA